MRALWERLRSFIRPRRVTDEIDREIQFHLEMEAQQAAAAGRSPADARREAARRFGGAVQAREQVHDVRGMTLMETVRQDVRFGLRMLRRSPGYTGAAVIILALGIGANTAMFSVLHGVLLQPLPYRNGHELVLVQHGDRVIPAGGAGVSIPELFEYRARLTSVKDLIEHHGMSFTLLNQGEPDRVDTGVVSANFFTMLGIQPLHGRTFLPDDDDLGAPAVLVLGHKYWKERFAGDPAVVGRVFEMNNRPHTVVGVLPDFPEYPRRNDVYMPTSACPFRSGAEQQLPVGGHRSFAALTVLGRLAPGRTAEDAGAEIATVAASFEKAHPDDYQQAGITGLTARVMPLKTQLTQDVRQLAWMLSGVTVLVLLIACANVANLSLARTSERGRELAVRATLGAGRTRLVRQLLTESLVLAAVGGVIGVGVAWVSLDVLIEFVGRFTARTGQIRIDGTVLGFSSVAALVSGVIFGSAPALAARRSLQAAMRSGGAQSGDGPGRQRVRGALVVAQVAVSCILLVGAGLLIESAYRLASEPLGFDGDRVLTAAIFGNFSRATTPADAHALTTRLLEKLRATPGVEAAATTNAVPQTAIRPGQASFEIEGRPTPAGTRRFVDPNTASDGYFDTLGIRLLSGRDIRAGDNADAPPVAVINAAMARHWGGADPIGSRFTVPRTVPATMTVIGVVPDFRLYSADQQTEVPAQYFVPVAQSGGFAGRVMLRTSGEPMTFVPALKAAVHGADPQIPVEEVQTLADLRNERQASPRLTTLLLVIFAGIALVITIVGIAGVIGTSVTQRTREFGLRMALGASPRSVMTLILRQGLVLVVAGLAIGIAGAAAFSEVLTAYLYDTPPTDPRAYLGVVAVFIAAGLAACFVPARRATAIDPLSSLKAD
jgi:putative ABC transport system permease protein